MAIIEGQEEVEYVPLSQQEEWKDVEPIPQDDGPSPVCPIAYTDEYKELLGYFRAISAKDEISMRALDLTSKVIEENPGHYTVWVYRKKLVDKLDVDMNAELNWVEEISSIHPKNYQLWHYRESIVIRLLDPESPAAKKTQDELVSNPIVRRELLFIGNVIENDSKNFHAWAYRQWLVRTYGIWNQELAFVGNMINEDVRNNSAWNQRYFVLKSMDSFSDQGTVSDEIDYTVSMIKIAPNNESPWSYIVGLLLRHAPEMLYLKLLPKIQEVADNTSCKEAMQSSPFYWSAVIDIYEQMGKDCLEKKAEALDKAQNACETLAVECDPIRGAYWMFRKNQLSSVLAPV